MLKEKIQKDLVEAQKAKEELKVSTLRLLNSAIKSFEIEKESTSYSASDEEIVTLIQKQIKQRKESIEAFKKGGREEMAQKEADEIKILQTYLPEQLSEEEINSLIEQAIKETGAKEISDMGKVMGKLSIELKGKADLGLVGKIVREKLS